MPLSDFELARLEDGRLILRTSPLRLRWSLTDLASADGHTMRCTFSCSARALDDSAERAMLSEVFLGRKKSVAQDDVVAHFAAGLRAAAAKMALGRGADLWLADNAADEMRSALQSAAEKIAFSCGIELLAPFHVDLDSPSFEQQKIEALERNLAERRASGQVEHFQRAAELLKQFQSLRDASPNLSPGAVLEQLGPTEQGPMLQTLLLAAGKKNAAHLLWAVSGPSLVKIDVKSLPPKMELIAMPPSIGPLRSVQQGEIDGQAVLLVGGRSGVGILRADDPANVQAYLDPQIQSELGFNRVIIHHSAIWACHGGAGIVSWDLGQHDAPRLAIRPALFGGAEANQTPSQASVSFQRALNPRHLNILDEDRLIFSVGSRLLSIDHDGKVTPLDIPASSDVALIVIDKRRLIVVRENGDITVFDRSTLSCQLQESRGSRISAAGVLPWLSSIRLLLAGEDGPIQCVGFDDQLVTQYASAHRSVRQVAGAADMVAAVSSDRQRLILWNSWDGRKPIAEFSVAAVAKHRIADISFA